MGGRGAQKTDGCLSGFFGTGEKKTKTERNRINQGFPGNWHLEFVRFPVRNGVRNGVRNLTENLREIYTIIRDRVKDRERDKDIIARSSNLLRSLASKPAPEFPMKGLSDHGYLEPGEPIAIRGDRASDDE